MLYKFILFLFFFILINPRVNDRKHRIRNKGRDLKNAVNLIYGKRLNNKEFKSVSLNNLKDSAFVDLFAILFIVGVESNHILNYLNEQLKIIFQENKMVQDIINNIRNDLVLFKDLYEYLVNRENFFDRQSIKNKILLYNKIFYDKYFNIKDKFLYCSKSSFSIFMNVHDIFKISHFFKNNNISQILEKSKRNEDLNQDELALISNYRVFEKLYKENIIIKDTIVDFQVIRMQKKKLIIDEDSDEKFFKLFFEKLKNKNEIIHNIILSYIYFLLLKSKIISEKKFLDQVSFTIFDKSSMYYDLKNINQTLLKSAEVINNVWKIISENKELFFNTNKYKYIENIDKLGGMSKYLEEYIFNFSKNFKKNNSLKSKIKKSLPTVGKTLAIGALIGAGIYTVGKISGNNFFSQGMESLRYSANNFITWTKEASSKEIIYKVATKPLISTGTNMLLALPVETLSSGLSSVMNKMFPSMASKSMFIFLSNILSLFITKKTYNYLSDNIVKPFANKIGKDKFYFNFYNYSKNKIGDYINKVKKYYIYNLSSNAINESFILEELFENQSTIENIIILSNNEENKQLEEIELLAREQLETDINQINYERKIKKIFEKI